ncbi:hypothetical protein RhiirA5_437721 [Rhizophagus irregularis]|uniref:Uncharacterized protein n=1 Tax=Rhizophagus irregularis TaxID=588596 RepID=A0A2N0NK34_9GLOM|nr:hypothetical protein RhiirA5_437721 [Rhizophagus irregularis]
MKIERLENTSKEEIVELKSEISSQLYQARKDIRTISSRKNLPERENYSVLYNSDDNMATITELANAIDDYVEFCKQRRYYDAEAERDNEIIRRQLAKSRIANVIGDLH